MPLLCKCPIYLSGVVNDQVGKSDLQIGKSETQIGKSDPQIGKSKKLKRNRKVPKTCY